MLKWNTYICNAVTHGVPSMVILIQEVSWDFTIRDAWVSPFFSQTPATSFVPFGHLLTMWWSLSPRLRTSWYRGCLPWPRDPAILASICLVFGSVKNLPRARKRTSCPISGEFWMWHPNIFLLCYFSIHPYNIPPLFGFTWICLFPSVQTER